MKFSKIIPSILEYDKGSDLNLKKKLFNKLSNSTKTIMLVISYQDKFQVNNGKHKISRPF